MSKTIRENLGYIGSEFQVKFVAQILTDNNFAKSIIDIVEPNYFDNQYLKVICSTLKDAYSDSEIILDTTSLESRLLKNISNETQREFVLAELKKVKDASLNDTIWVQETAMNFCKQQALKKSIKEMQTIIENGNFDDYSKCEEILKNALEFGQKKDSSIDVFDNIESVLADDFRDPIPTGVRVLDEVMNGGLAKGELGILLAPFGVGKTTGITKFANTAKNLGYNVLQIFFEDNPKVIQRKHLSCWTGYELNDLQNHKEELIELSDRKKKEKGKLVLQKLPSDGITIPIIRQLIRKLIAQGFKPDMVLLDYIDCVQPSKNYDDSNVAEGSVMRQFESMLSELDIAGWTAIQGNRCVWVNELVDIKGKGKLKIGDVKEGDKILTHKGYKEITTVFPIQKQVVYKIKTKSGKEIKVSSKHYFPTGDGSLKSINTGLKLGDKLLIKK